MANTIILKRSATPGKVPTTAQLALGEIAINTYDGLIYIKKNDGTESIAQIGGVTSVNGETGSITISSDDISDAGQTNKWFANSLARGAISAGSGISYNSGTGVISTTQTLTTSGSPTFAGLTLTGNIGITGSIIPSADITFDLGSPTRQWKDIYVGPGSLYVNGTKVLEDDNDTITFSADADQNIRIKTVGAGILQLGTSTTNVNIDGTLQLASGKRITDQAGVKVNFGDDIEMNGNKVIGLGAPVSNTDAATKKYVDDSVGAISQSSIQQGNTNIAVTDTGSGQVLVTVDGSTALTVTSAGVVVAGNFTVSGTTTTVNSNTVAVADNILTLNSDTTGTPTQNAGVEVERGDEANVQLRWNEGSQKWTFTNDGATYNPMAVSTTDLAEGTNLYHTTARARNAVSASSSTGISYNSSTGAFSLGSIPNASLANSGITINGTSVALGGTRTLDTDAVSEGSTNQYFTQGRARSAVSFTAGSGAYNSSTGVFTVPTNTSHLTNGANFITLASLSASGDVAYNSTTGVISFTQNKAWSALTGTPTTISGYGITNAYTKTEVDSAISTAVAGKDNTDEITEGTTNLFFTNARAISANTSAIATAKSEAISAAASAAATAIANAVAAKDNTDEITEGSTNLYFTNARARAAVSAGTGISYNSTTGVITNTITQYTDAAARGAVSAGTGISYNSTTGVITNTITQYTDAAARGAVSASGSLSYNSSTGVFSYTTPSTSGISEGSNLYYTDARARAAVSAGTGISYNSTTGVITNTITQYTDAAARGAVSFTAGSGAYNSTTGVFTIPTNTNQLTNGAGFITGYTETSTLDAVVARGASTSRAMSTGALTVSGNITATGEITAYYSDARLKTNVAKIDSALDKVMAINGYTYDSSELAQSLGLPKHMDQIGLMADEVEAVLPELVTQSAIEGYKTIRYDKVVSVLVNAIKEQQAMIEELRKDVKKTLH